MEKPCKREDSASPTSLSNDSDGGGQRNPCKPRCARCPCKPPCAPDADRKPRTGRSTPHRIDGPSTRPTCVCVCESSSVARRALLVGNVCALSDGRNGPELRPTGMVEGFIPRSASLKLLRDGPALLGVVIAQPQANQMATTVGRVGPTLPSMQHGHVVPEQHVASLQLLCQSVFLSSKLNCVQSLHLSSAQVWNTRSARGGGVANEGSTGEREKDPILTRGVENRANHVRGRLAKTAVTVSGVEHGGAGGAGVCLTGRRPKKKRTRGG
jgi:hypothetical protein